MCIGELLCDTAKEPGGRQIIDKQDAFVKGKEDLSEFPSTHITLYLLTISREHDRENAEYGFGRAWFEGGGIAN